MSFSTSRLFLRTAGQSSLVVLILALVGPSAFAEPPRNVGAEPAATPRADPERLRLVAELVEAGPETAVLDVYERYEATARRSGHDLRLRLSDVRTVPFTGFTRHSWLDLMTPPSGIHVVQARRYFEAPWIEGRRVFYDLSWKQHGAGAEAKTFRLLAELQRATIRDQLLELQREGRLAELPLAVTSYRVRVSLDGRGRTYRAAGFWFAAADAEEAELQLQDHVVPHVASAMTETAAVATAEEWAELRETPPPPVSRVQGQATAEECYSYNERVRHTALENFNGQGHAAGYHTAVLRMRADCSADTGCYVQCAPAITLQGCGESTDANVSGTCHHYPVYDTQISGGSAYDSKAGCGAAIACGVKECCSLFCGPTGGVNLSFSGSAGGLTASASASGGDVVYNLSINDSIECRPPTKKSDPCASTVTSGSTGRAAAALLINCDDGGGGADGGGDDDGASNDDAGDGTPILLDFGGSGFELTDLDGGVAFDLDADGVAERLSWTAPGSDDAFLVLDRDGDGAIDDGSELFGDATPQPPSDEPHGYRALAVFDDDGDGRITAADAVFADLEVWWDRDHDGVADAGERSSLAAAGVTAIELDYVVSMRRDRHGNLIRYTSRFGVAEPQGRSHYPAADVIFLSAQP